MLPKSSKHFIQPTADELDCDPSLVEDVVSFFYNDAKKALVEMRGPNIQLENLGSFKAKPGELPKLVVKYEKHLAVLRPETFYQMATKKDIELRLGRVNGLKKMIDDERERHQVFKEHKKRNGTNSDLEE